MFDIPMNTTGALDVASLAGQSSSMGQQVNSFTQQAQPQPQAQQYGLPQPEAFRQANTASPHQVMPTTQPAAQQVIGTKQHPLGTGVHLKKGQKFALQGTNGGQLQKIQVGLGWDLVNQACDLDASAFMLDANNKIIGDEWFVFYGQTVSPDGSVQHSGDSNGAGMGDDETIYINLAQVNPAVQKIVFVVTIDEALQNNLNFSMVANAYVRVIDSALNSEIARFSLTEYYATVTSMVVGELYKHNGSWKFNAVGDGVAKDLYGLCTMYGVNIAD